MHSFTIVSALFAAAAFAAPSPAPGNNVALAPRKIADVHAQAQSMIDAKTNDGCEVLSMWKLFVETTWDLSC